MRLTIADIKPYILSFFFQESQTVKSSLFIKKAAVYSQYNFLYVTTQRK